MLRCSQITFSKKKKKGKITDIFSLVPTLSEPAALPYGAAPTCVTKQSNPRDGVL